MPLDNPQGYRKQYRQQLQQDGYSGDDLRARLRGLMKTTRTANRMADRNPNRPAIQNNNPFALFQKAGNKVGQRGYPTGGPRVLVPGTYSNDLRSLIMQFIRGLWG